MIKIVIPLTSKLSNCYFTDEYILNNTDVYIANKEFLVLFDTFENISAMVGNSGKLTQHLIIQHVIIQFINGEFFVGSSSGNELRLTAESSLPLAFPE